ncbi:Replication protein A 70 kDa DNA-binding subunit B, partial [Bienertia sinuspersici]
MKKEYTPLATLNEKSKGYKVKVKVIQKAKPKQSPGKKRYQKLLLKDDEGTVMKGAIFHDDIESFDSALKRNGEYEISSASIQVIPQQFSSKAGELQMNFNDRVKIIPISQDNCSDEPQYMRLFAIPVAEEKTDMLLDILGVVLFVGETREFIVGNDTQYVHDIYITDDRMRTARAQSSMVVGFVGVQPLTRKGLSLTTSMSTDFVIQPTGDRADELRRCKCGRSTGYDEGVKFRCTNCKTPDAISTPSKVTFKFNAVDSPGAYKFIVFTKDAETLFGIPCADLHKLVA